MKTLRRCVLIAMLAAVPLQASAEALCKQSKLKTVAADHPECLYFSGTEQFRSKDFAGAARYWQRLVDTKSVPIEHAHLRIDAHNNLGFLYFTGQGVQQDRKRALEYWSLAYHAGHEEAAYHLCHAYMEEGEPADRRAQGRAYCREASRRYARLDRKERKEAAEIMAQIEKFEKRAVAR
jgi:TPR repeat protein